MLPSAAAAAARPMLLLLLLLLVCPVRRCCWACLAGCMHRACTQF
jgi:hypothetical protein